MRSHMVFAVLAIAAPVLSGCGGAAFGAPAALFDGKSGYVEIPNPPDSAYGQPATRTLTVEAWIKPSTLQMPVAEGTGYVQWLGKGEAGVDGAPSNYEWAFRFYNQTSTDTPSRANRIDFFIFNPSAQPGSPNLGSGSYFQECPPPGPGGTCQTQPAYPPADMTPFYLGVPPRVLPTPPPAASIDTEHWIYVVGVIDDKNTYIYKDGYARGCDDYAETTPRTRGCQGRAAGAPAVTPAHGPAPVRIGTRDRKSYFKGAISRVAIYGAALTMTQIQAHLAAARSGDEAYDRAILAEPGLVGYWPLSERDATSTTARNLKDPTRNGIYVNVGTGVKPGGAGWLK